MSVTAKAAVTPLLTAKRGIRSPDVFVRHCIHRTAEEPPGALSRQIFMILADPFYPCRKSITSHPSQEPALPACRQSPERPRQARWQVHLLPQRAFRDLREVPTRPWPIPEPSRDDRS